MEKIEPYFEINPDYEGCLGYFSVDNCNYGCDDDILELNGYESTPFVVPGLEAWCWEWDKEAHRSLDCFLLFRLMISGWNVVSTWPSDCDRFCRMR